MPDFERDLAQIAKQEAALQFTAFDAHTAWELGSKLRQVAVERKAPVTIEITMNGQRLFYSSLPGTTPVNDDWVRRKRNVVELYHRSTYGVGQGNRQQGITLTEKIGVPLIDYATNGGAFPLLVRGAGCVGSVIVSGLAQREDHNLVVEVLADYLGVSLTEIALD
ncbi:heme-degrading domain-containing protein [Silvimonas soli]|uniref:heme-degrading domain-containing protein n=1 Tax=Silvimonas soli TaxID=2980100 RepID=UPI0024B3B406|nr:heme-degrading domain-containing protein [Silvimonas soli]